MSEKNISFLELHLSKKEIRHLKLIKSNSSTPYSSEFDRLIRQDLIETNQKKLANGYYVSDGTYHLSERGNDYLQYVKNNRNSYIIQILSAIFSFLACVLAFKEEIILWICRLIKLN